VQQESNVNTPITLIYSNRGRSLPIEDNLCNGAFIRAACVCRCTRREETQRERGREPQRESRDYRLDKQATVANKIDKDQLVPSTRHNSFRVHPRDKFRARVEKRKEESAKARGGEWRTIVSSDARACPSEGPASRRSIALLECVISRHVCIFR